MWTTTILETLFGKVVDLVKSLQVSKNKPQQQSNARLESTGDFTTI